MGTKPDGLAKNNIKDQIGKFEKHFAVFMVRNRTDMKEDQKHSKVDWEQIENDFFDGKAKEFSEVDGKPFKHRNRLGVQNLASYVSKELLARLHKSLEDPDQWIELKKKRSEEQKEAESYKVNLDKLRRPKNFSTVLRKVAENC